MKNQLELDMFCENAPEDPPRAEVNALVVKQLGGVVKDILPPKMMLPERGLPVTKDGEYKRIPPSIRLDDARNSVQFEEIAMRDHRENRLRRHRGRRW